eukprot:UN30203
MPIVCEENEHVFDHECRPCEPGYKREEGDKASGENTLCQPIICHENEHVLNHECVSCEWGFVNEAGDRASGDDTPCRDASIRCRYEAIDESECPGTCEGPDEVACDTMGLEDIMCPPTLSAVGDPRRNVGAVVFPEEEEEYETINGSVWCEEAFGGLTEEAFGGLGMTRRELQNPNVFDPDGNNLAVDSPSGEDNGFILDIGCNYWKLDWDCGLLNCPHNVYDERLEDGELCELDMFDFVHEANLAIGNLPEGPPRRQLEIYAEDLIGNCGTGEHDVYRKVCERIELYIINILWFYPLDIEQCYFVLETGLLHQAFANWMRVDINSIVLECFEEVLDRRELKDSERGNREAGKSAIDAAVGGHVDELELRNFVDFILADKERNGDGNDLTDLDEV